MEIRYLLLLILPSTSFALSIDTRLMQESTIFARDDASTCATDRTLQACPSNLPFCCPKNTSCKPTTPDNSSIICCPSGADCSFIQPVLCDITQQNATAYPSNTLHTTDLTAVLPTCGKSCCPLGYTCQNGLCALSNNAPSPSSRSSATASSSPTSTNPPVVIPTNIPQDSTTKTTSSSSQFPPGAVILGLILGLLAGAALALLIPFLLRRRRQNHQNSNGRSSKSKLARASTDTFMGTTPRPPSPQPLSSSNTTLAAPPIHENTGQTYYAPAKAQPGATATVNSISEPIWAQDHGPPAHRTDFLLRRGDCSTGLEDRIATRSSTAPPGASTLERGRSKRAMAEAAATPVSEAAGAVGRSSTVPGGTADGALKTPDGQGNKPGRLPPLFSSPLKFGLPVSPSPASARKGANPPKRPLRSDENVPRVTSLSHSEDTTNSVVYGPYVPPNSNPALQVPAGARTGSRRRDDSQRRPLMGERSESQDSNVTILSDSDGGDQRAPEMRERDNNGGAPKADSSETINVLLPPPNIFRTPPPSGGRVIDGPYGGPQGRARDGGAEGRWDAGTDAERRDTTFEDLMKQAGWRRSEWKKG